MWREGTGGAEMAKELETITLLDVYRAVECLGKTGQLFGFHDIQIQPVRLEIIFMEC